MNKLKVYYPHGGHHFLLHWWTYNERGHVVLARTEGSVYSTATSVFRKHSDAEVRAYSEVEIVAPSALMCKRAAEFDLQESISSFHQQIVYRLNDVVKGGKELPLQFEMCEAFEPKDLDGAPCDWANETHYSCKNCTDKIKMIGMTKEELHAKYSSTWKKLSPSKIYIDKNKVLSRAAPAKDNEELHYAKAEFGHHSSGIELDRMNLSKFDPTYRPEYLTGRVIFFYRKVRDLDAAPLQLMLDQQRQAIQERKAIGERQRIAKREQDKRNDIELTLSLFQETK